MPQPFPGARIEHHQTVAKQIVADPVGAVIIGGRESGRQNTMPRLSSTVISPHLFAPPEYCHASCGHVS